MNYSEKLKDVKWQKKRLKILERDNWSCVRCNKTTGEMHVHHLKYDGDPWNVDDKFLEVLCKLCHTKEHFTKLPDPEITELNEELISIPKKDPEVVFELWLIDNNFRLKSLKSHYLSIIHWVESGGDESTTVQAKNDLSEWCYKSKIIFIALNGDVYGEKETVVRHG